MNKNEISCIFKYNGLMKTKFMMGLKTSTPKKRLNSKIILILLLYNYTIESNFRINKFTQ